jgi:hypothetical protein
VVLRRNALRHVVCQYGNLGAVRDRRQCPGHVHGTGKLRVIGCEFKALAHAFVRNQVQKHAGDDVRIGGGLAGACRFGRIENECNAECTARLGLEGFDDAVGAFGRQPFLDLVTVGEGAIDAFGCGLDVTVSAICAHGRLLFISGNA